MLWNESSKIISNRLGLTAPAAPKKIIYIEAPEAKRIGGHVDISRETLYLSDDVTRNEVPLIGVVFRESLFYVLPITLCEEARRDIASEYARQRLNPPDRKKWEAFWKTIPTRRVRANLVYASFNEINWMISLGGDKELDTLIHEFLSMSRYGQEVKLVDYIEYMSRRSQDIVVGLSHTELKIIDALLKFPESTYAEIANHTRLSDSWVSTQVNHLKKRYTLVHLTVTPFSKIGIRTFHVMLSGPSNDEPSQYLTECPFLYNIQHILNGPWQVISRLAVPDNTKCVESLNEMRSILTDIGIAVDISETHSAALNNSFYHYNVANRRWEIPWIAMFGWGKRIKDESLSKAVSRLDTPAKKTDTYLDDIDMQILGLINKGVTSIRTLRRELAIGQNRLSKRIKNLRSDGLIKKDWSVYNMGLVERVALRVTDKQASGILDLWSRELPRTFLRYDETRNLLMISELPSGGSSKMMETIRKLNWPVSISLLGGGVWGQWSFPTNLWDIEKQRWSAPIESIDRWLDHVVDTCESVIKTQPRSLVLSQKRKS